MTEMAENVPPKEVSKPQEYNEGRAKQRIVWFNVLRIGYLHFAGTYGCYLFSHCKTSTLVFSAIVAYCTGLGVTAGAHRLWTHRAYKAKTGLRIVLMLWQTLSMQNPIIVWARDHRVHHKFTDTDADPHNASRGFFFSHVGWLLLTKHPEVTRKGKTVDLSDMEADPVIRFQHKYFWPLTYVIGFIIPLAAVYYVFGESLWIAYHISLARYMLLLNITFMTNSGAHLWGMKPYDKSIRATDSLAIGIMSIGEGWHNFHHVFPWDYKASELSTYGYNISIPFIDFCAKMGWAYELKYVSDEMIRKRMTRTGDGSNKYSNIKDVPPKVENPNSNTNCNKSQPEKTEGNKLNIWGWDDNDMSQEERKLVNVYNNGVKGL